MTENAEKEPTMEEILSSIRRIISEEDEEVARDPERASDAFGEDDDDGEALELTELADASAAQEPADFAPDEDDILVLDRDDQIEPGAGGAAAGTAPEPNYEMARTAEAESTPAAAMARIGEREAEASAPRGAMEWGREDTLTDRLLSEQSAHAAAGAFGLLQRNTRIPESDDDKSLETIVRELLRPMLKDWLDAHLPGIVERKVREEVERIARQA